MLEKIYNEKIMFWFIVLQPIIDVITAYMVQNTSLPITLGILVRTLFLIYAIIFLLFVTKQKKKYFIVYLSLILFYCVFNVVLNITFNSNYILFAEINNLAKLFYFPILICFFYAYYKDNHQLSIRTIIIPTIIIGLVILIGDITNTSTLSYGSGMDAKNGQVGWFYSPNEIGAMVGILFPLVFYSFFEIKNKWALFLVFLNIYALLVIGTKVAFLAIVITVLGVIFFKIFRAIFYKEKIPDYVVKISLILAAIITMVLPVTPIAHNMGIHLTNLKMNSITDIFNTEGNNIDNLVFFGREDYLNDMKEVYKQSTSLQKAFGMGRESLMLDGEKVKSYIERDFHDVFYYYGYIGFVVFLLPIIILLYRTIIPISKGIKEKLDIKTITLGISIFIGLSAAFIAGHVLLYPAVSIYVAIMINMMYCHINNR